MIRVVFFLLIAGAIAIGAIWLADRPGDVAITWLGYRIETSLMVATTAMLAVAVAAVILWSVFRFVWRSPEMVSLSLRARRQVKGYLAVSRGLIAVGAGDAQAARKFAKEAGRIAASEPLALLLRAQTAQLDGDRAEAERVFRAMAERDDTKLLGLRGLYVEAQRREDANAARFYAEEAANAAPSVAWAGQAVLEFRCAGADWNGALATLERNLKGRLIDKPTYKRQRAVLLTARALAIEDSDVDTARELAREAVKLAPDLVPAATLAARRLAEVGEIRKAGRIIESAWRKNPHPDLAQAYAYLRYGDSARDRLARIRSLTRQPAEHPEGAIAMAHAALDAQDFTAARAALAPLLDHPTQRVALLMADLEQAEHGDEGRARAWTTRALRAARDPAWTADGFVSERWMPVSPVTGRLDAFQWRVPLTQIADEGTVIEAGEPPRPAQELPPVARIRESAPELAEAPAASPPPPAAKPATRPPAKRVEPVEAVIPLIHAPDDPGPEAEMASEPPPERRRWFSVGGLFR